MVSKFKLLILAVVTIGTVWVVWTADEPLEVYQKRPMKPLSLTALDGREISTATWALETNGPKVINLFASWCTPCIAELPELEKLNDHVPVYGIAFRDSTEDIKVWLEEHGNPYKEVGIDSGLIFSWDLGITAVPTTLLLDASNKIVYIKQGALTEADIERDILPKLKVLNGE